MDKIFSFKASRKDQNLAAFMSSNKSGLLADICCNPHTGYVVEAVDSVRVPMHAAEKVAQYLQNQGWKIAE